MIKLHRPSWDVFISHAHEDAAFARRVADFLQEHGLRCWLDHQEVRLADPYDERILDGVRRSSLVLALISRAALNKPYVRHEISSAIGRGKKVAPVYLEALRPEELRPPFVFKALRTHALLFDMNQPEKSLNRIRRDVVSLTRWRRFPGSLWPLALVLMLALAGFGLDRYLRHRLEGISQLILAARPPTPHEAILRPSLSFEVFGLPKGTKMYRRMVDGSRLATGDEYFIQVHPLTDGFLYVADVDASGQIQWLFPQNKSFKDSEGANPIRAGETFTIPRKSAEVFSLDAQTGFETFFAFFSSTRWPELDSLLERGRGAGRLTQLALKRLSGRAKGTAGKVGSAIPHPSSRGVPEMALPVEATGSDGALLAREHWLLETREIEHVPNQ